MTIQNGIIDVVGSRASETFTIDQLAGDVTSVTVGGATQAAAGITDVRIVGAGGKDTVIFNEANFGTGSLRGVSLDFTEVNQAGIRVSDGDPDTVIYNAGINASPYAIFQGGSQYGVASDGGVRLAANGAELFDSFVFNGSAGDDVVQLFNDNGRLGSLVINGGLGSDSLEWLGGSATFNGGEGSDLLNVNTFQDTPGVVGLIGADGAAAVTNASDASTLIVTGVEQVVLTGSPDIDGFSIRDLADSGIESVVVDFGAPDTSADSFVVATGDTDDTIVFDGGDAVLSTTISGLGADVRVVGAGREDLVVVDGAGGDDLISVAGGPFGETVLLGGEGDDTLVGGASTDTLDGGEGDDLLAFGFFEAGDDLVIGFQAHDASGAHDVLSLNSFGVDSFADLLASGLVVELGGDVVITTDAGSITLAGVTLGALNDTDFLFG